MKKLSNVLKVVISLALLYLIFTKVSKENLLTSIKSTNYIYLVPGVILYFIAILASAWRWQVFLKIKLIDHSLLKCLKYYLIGIFSGNFLPSGGLDVVRAYYAGRGNSVSSALAATFIDRLSGFYAILFYLIIAGIFLTIKIQSLFLITIIGIVALLFLNVILFTKSFNKLLNKIKKTKLTSPVISFINSIYQFREEWPLILKTLPLSIAIQLFFSLVPIVISPGLGTPIPFFESILLLPIINFVMMIPVTISGLGLREGAFVLLYGDLIGKEKALILSLMYYFTSLALSIVGYILFLIDKPEKNLK
ncbi:MAG TPA: lysylphosphatidylglycerol synthase transmembrane domain-containing protein [Candidatus Hydrothermia bacterium]|nr:lysylphosphatidylglycerol synthase transmembrane domain-containing protein [Candidatus Hydrothermia bacterium]